MSISAERGAGVLLHITSLPSKFGIGTLGNEAFEFVDFLVDSGFKYWQILPLAPTGYGDSPYQAFSSFAGNPYLIDLQLLKNKGWVSDADLNTADFGDDPSAVDYGLLFKNRFKILHKAFLNYGKSVRFEIDGFFELLGKNFTKQIDDYCIFATMKHKNPAPWYLQSEGLKFRNPDTLAQFCEQNAEEIQFQKFMQWCFFKQWFALKAYANKHRVLIIGDLPIYSAYDSADCWANPNCFMLDENMEAEFVGGCPPDAFSDDGQLWGNPVYRWDYIESTGWQWWIDRMEANFKLFDIVRLDHFRGFDAYWSVPSNEVTAKNGKWELGPGLKLFDVLKNRFGQLPIIAEDLGLISDEVIHLRNTTGLPGMKVLQFAFNPDEESDYLPHKFETENCVVYTGTHDNPTMQGWIDTAPKEQIEFAMKYFNARKNNLITAFIKACFFSIADLAIVPAQDFLGLDNRARMNHPSKIGGWKWRMTSSEFKELLKKEKSIKTMLKKSNRI